MTKTLTEKLMTMDRCFKKTPEIHKVPPARCLRCADLNPCRAYVRLTSGARS